MRSSEMQGASLLLRSLIFKIRLKISSAQKKREFSESLNSRLESLGKGHRRKKSRSFQTLVDQFVLAISIISKKVKNILFSLIKIMWITLRLQGLLWQKTRLNALTIFGFELGHEFIHSNKCKHSTSSSFSVMRSSGTRLLMS